MAKKMEHCWLKIVREDHGLHQRDEINGSRIQDGTMFRVRFPSGKILELPALVRHEVVVMDDKHPRPFLRAEERVYFAVPFEGLQQIWLRGLDVEVQPI